MNLGSMTKKQKEEKATELLGSSRKIPQMTTQLAVTQKYGIKQSDGHGTIARDEGLYTGALRVDASKPGPYRILEFHGIKGQVPAEFQHQYHQAKKV